MSLYADTSFWLSLWHEEDEHHARAMTWAKRFRREPWLWTELHAVEVPCAARAAMHRDREAVPEAVARAIVWRAQRAARGPGMLRRELPLVESVHQVNVLGEAHGWARRYTAFDLWHVAAAVVMAADWFLTFDERQADLAVKAGLRLP
jgi:predicted nucleic acid-binding protein